MPEMMALPLIEAATETFETLAYAFAEQDAPDERGLRADGVAVVEFDGPIHGRLVFRLAGDVLAVLAANMLGQDDAPTPAMQQDALGELANVICGNMLPRLVGATAVFSLRAPRFDLGWDAACGVAHTSSAFAALGIEHGRADLALYVFDADLRGWAA